MSELVNVVVALAVIVFIVRWATSAKESPEQQSTTAALGFRPKNVTEEMITTMQNMFPDIPRDNIKFDLLRTGSVERTSNKILEKGFLDAPPAGYYRAFPTSNTVNATNVPTPNNSQQTGQATGASTAGPSQKQTLISRFHLESRISSPADASAITELQDAGGKATWEDSAEKREASLKERKAKMVLAARERLLAQQRQQAESSTTSASS